jgi:hypothetical protein
MHRREIVPQHEIAHTAPVLRHSAASQPLDEPLQLQISENQRFEL